MERVLGVLARLNAPQRAAIQRCVELMCHGMPRFQFSASLKGLAGSSDLDDYCYYVAGVVGEMLTDLFCDYSPQIARHRPKLFAVAASFAQGLQMTNILKDVWEDRSRGACWLPQEVFTRHGLELAKVSSQPYDPRFGAAFLELVGVAHAHLRNALDYTLLIPARETGIRRFCLWAIGLAVLTLRKIEQNPRFTAGDEVKVTRSAVSHDPFVDQCRRTQRLDAPAPVRAGRPRSAACLSARTAPPAPDAGRAWRRSASNRSRRCADPTGKVRERIAPKPGSHPAPQSDARGDVVSHTLRRVTDLAAGSGMVDARDALLARQDAARLLVVRARGRLHHPGGVHHDDALPG